MDFFRAHRAINTTIPTYFIESTAPNNVDDFDAADEGSSPELEKLSVEVALQRIAGVLAEGHDSNLVVMVHGFNNPLASVLKMYTAAATAIECDPVIKGRKGLVCVGYRWPSERMWRQWHGTWSALPTLPIWLIGVGVVLAALPFLLFYFAPDSANWPLDIFRFFRGPTADHLMTLAGLALTGLVITAALLRVIVYFRDTYRATNFGVPDLVQIICTIDGKISEIRGSKEPNNNVQLSFIGHSMGGFVVTNTIRVLSDVFKSPVTRAEAFGAGGDERPSPDVGRAFVLKRFVLASPDIPAETLVTSRGNFLATSLTRFDEAYLFSNEGDEVLRQISTLANYFVFPTKSRDHGFRLGNVEILSRSFGLIDVDEADFLRVLRIGNLTLQELYDKLRVADVERQRSYGVQQNQHVEPPQPPSPMDGPLPTKFTYFDCTDYKDGDNENRQKVRSLLTFAKWRKQFDEIARLGWHSHIWLLIAYVLRPRPNVHGGYFEGLLTQQLIYRLACLGYDDTVQAYRGEAGIATECASKQIRMLVSPKLRGRREAPVAPPAGGAASSGRSDSPPPPPSSPNGLSTVPELVGMTITAARAKVAEVRRAQPAVSVPGAASQLLLLEITREAPDSPSGTVLSQEPKAGTPLRQRTSIEVSVAKRAEP
jgi:hypothetical protein